MKNKKEIKREAEAITKEISVKSPDAVVGIGASAGGLDSIKRFFNHLPLNLNCAFIIVQHLSPDFDSLMDEILPRHTHLKIEVVDGSSTLKGEHVYILKKPMLVEVINDSIVAYAPGSGHLNNPIDTLFRSLAYEWRNRAVGIVLSGGGSDGTEGCVTLRQNNGLVIAQEANSAEFASMPQCAINSQSVDFVATPENIGKLLSNYLETLHQKIPNNLNERVVTEISNYISQVSSFKIECYKHSTIERRINYRIKMLDIGSLDEYLVYLKRNNNEAELLIKSFQIGVTHFFRDASVWSYIKQAILPELFNIKGRPLRIWSVGCATGEEAFSIALLLEEESRRLNQPITYKVFATDIDEVAIRKASNGCYTKKDLIGIEPSMLERYFDVLGDVYCVKSQIRDNMIFSVHDVLAQPPFSKIDLVVCRNLLIYFESDAQKNILSRLNFALNDDAFLVLGSAESISLLRQYYSDEEPRKKIYRKKERAKISGIDQPFVLHDLKHLRATRATEGTMALSPRNQFSEAGAAGVSIAHQIKRFLHKKFVLPSLVIDRHEQVVYLTDGLEPFIKRQLNEGTLSFHIASLLSSSLVRFVEQSIKKLDEKNTKIAITDIEFNDLLLGMSLERFSLDSSSTDYYIVISFLKQFRKKDSVTKVFTQQAAETTIQIDELTADLAEAKLIIKDNNQIIDTINAELEQGKQELTIFNEELQSSNEELHSVNEELYSVNAELQEKIQQLNAANNDLDQVLQFSKLGVVFLDYGLKIRRFTSTAKQFVNILPIDVGRPVSDLNFKVDVKRLDKLLNKATLEEVEVIEHCKLVDDENTRVVLTIRTYQRDIDNVKGVVILFERIKPYDDNQALS